MNENELLTTFEIRKRFLRTICDDLTLQRLEYNALPWWKRLGRRKPRHPTLSSGGFSVKM